MKPSSYDNQLKLDIINPRTQVAECKLWKVQLLLGLQPDRNVSPFQRDSTGAFCYQSVYHQDGKWHPTRRFLHCSYGLLHSTIERSDLSIAYRNAYEIILEDRCRHLYFDVDVTRPEGVHISDHDASCWSRVRVLLDLVGKVYGCVIRISLSSLLFCIIWYTLLNAGACSTPTHATYPSTCVLVLTGLHTPNARKSSLVI